MLKSVKNISFAAANPQYLKTAKEEFEIMNTISGELVESLQFDILTKKIAPHDGLDTVKELRKYTKPKYQKLLDSVVEICAIMTKKLK